ncbi:MAG: hypothetical protein ACT4P6_16795 [Gemmatimonadaceae bacterium]
MSTANRGPTADAQVSFLAALAQQGATSVDVIVGLDVFNAHAAIIDYGSASLFLRDQ